jgi:selenocysteine lyase/cysteine desulfurase
VTEGASEEPLGEEFWNVPQKLRESIGTLISAPADSVSLVRSTAHAISLLAGGLDWKHGDNVVGARGEYPANVYPWMALEDRGVEMRFARNDGGRVEPESVLELVDGRTRVVALSQVEFWNGYRVDLETIGNECRSRGVILAVDAIQSAGVLRLDMEKLPIDFLAAGSYKWLLGPLGIGFAYWHPELIKRVRPLLVGVGSVKRNMEFFDYDLEFAPTAQRFQESGVSLLDAAAFQAAVDLFLEVGTAVVEDRVLDLSSMLAERLAGAGCELLEPWPRRREESSGIVSFRKPGQSAQDVMRSLNASKVVCRTHADFVRLSPHFYNTEEEVERVVGFVSPEKVQD